MIESIKLKFGRTPNSTPEEIVVTPITVFVGPNNSGKSKALTEINTYCTTGRKESSNIILEDIEFSQFPNTYVDEKINEVTLDPLPHETINAHHILIGKREVRNQVKKDALFAIFQDPKINLDFFCTYYLALHTLILDGRSRINLVNDQAGGDLQQPPQNSLQTLFQDDTKRQEVRRIIYDAFSEYLVVDPTALGQLRLRLSSRPPSINSEERGIDADAVKFHSEASHISEASDGVKAFTGIVTEIIAGDPSIILIDEPEAFLHPSLSGKLGKEIAASSLNSKKRVFISTHSPNFVMGCIRSGVPVNIIRLTYRAGVPTARILSNNEILHLMRNPLLRSIGVLSALSYEFVVVTESDADRAFYQEINERLLQYKPELGIPNCLFLNAQNKQTVQIILKPLRELGIPAAGIVDVDILKNGGKDWTNFLAGGFIPTIEHQSLGGIRSSIKSKIDSTGKDMKNDGGVEILSGSDKEAANNLFDKLGEYGLFVVRRGELESWLQNLGAPGHGPRWLIDIFEKMGEDPDLETYLKPSDDDVWGFIGQIQQWFINPSRKGIPS
jgi:hypothetical protein